MATGLVGRTSDRDRLGAVLRQLRAGLSAVLVVSGDPGIGKTRLLRWAAEDASDMQTVMVCGYEAEIGLGFAALHRLLLPLLNGLSRLPAPQRDALGTAFGLISGRLGSVISGRALEELIRTLSGLRGACSATGRAEEPA